MGLIFHNREIERLRLPEAWTGADVDRVAEALATHATLAVSALPTGLYPASAAMDPGVSGYQHVWVRDNVYVALAQWRTGRPRVAVGVARGLLAFYAKYPQRFVLTGGTAPPVMERPHVRFDGAALSEVAGQQWSHAQNDALGYCLWLCASLAAAGELILTEGDVATIQALVGYLRAIDYTRDEDSGHWEETRKVSASSIGIVTAGLRAWLDYLASDAAAGVPDATRTALSTQAAALLTAGQEALAGILPSECVQLVPEQNRRYDAALLFLVHPFGVVDGALADLIVSDVWRYLEGPIGIRRYLRDSYWAPDYERRVPPADRTRDYSNDIESRDALLDSVGREAQWCVFDPVMSALHGARFLVSRRREDAFLQGYYFNRSLAHITPHWGCPELYYERDGIYVPNPHTPLLWTQSNLLLALAAARATAVAS